MTHYIYRFLPNYLQRSEPNAFRSISAYMHLKQGTNMNTLVTPLLLFIP